MHRTQAPLPWRERAAAVPLDADTLAARIQDATASVNLARHEWQRTETEAAWNWLQACVQHRDLLLREARRQGLTHTPASERRTWRPFRSRAWDWLLLLLTVAAVAGLLGLAINLMDGGWRL